MHIQVPLHTQTSTPGHLTPGSNWLHQIQLWRPSLDISRHQRIAMQKLCASAGLPKKEPAVLDGLYGNIVFVLKFYSVRYWVYHIIKLVKASLCHLGACLWCWNPSRESLGPCLMLNILGLLVWSRWSNVVDVWYWNSNIFIPTMFVFDIPIFSIWSLQVLTSYFCIILVSFDASDSRVWSCGSQVVNRTSHVQLYFWNCQASAQAASERNHLMYRGRSWRIPF